MVRSKEAMSSTPDASAETTRHASALVDPACLVHLQGSQQERQADHSDRIERNHGPCQPCDIFVGNLIGRLEDADDLGDDHIW